MKSGGSAGSGPAAPDMQRTRNILQETIVELKKTTWPTKQEATRLTMVVLGVIFAMLAAAKPQSPFHALKSVEKVYEFNDAVEFLH